MMNTVLKRATAAAAIVFLLLSMVGCRKKDLPVQAKAMPDYTVLTVGLDDAAENTDVMFLFRISPRDGRAYVLQIPRDTLCGEAGAVRKINSRYPTFRAGGNSERQALERLRDLLTRKLGVPIDATVAFTTRAFRNAVDTLGGISVSSSEGEVFLPDGESAERFVRYRKGYATGDLGRLDAQKQFLSGLLRTLRERASTSLLVRLAVRCYDETITDLSLTDAAALLLRYGETVKKAEVSFATLPGQAALLDGVSYYVLNRDGVRNVMETAFPGWSEPSEMTYFRPSEETGLSDLFDGAGRPARIFSEKELSGVRIPHKREGAAS